MCWVTPGFSFERRTWGGRITSYYAVTENSVLLAGVSHSGPFDADDHCADIDGDGRSELICNSSGSADGRMMPSVFRLRDGVVEEGQLRADFYSTLSSEPLWSGATQEYYDAGRGAFVVRYVLPETEEERTVELTDYEHFTFALPSSYAPFYAQAADIDFRFEWEADTTVRVRLADDMILDFPAYEVTEFSGPVFRHKTYYAFTGAGALTKIAYNFGYDDDFDFIMPIDFDGDGRSELLTRVSYGGTGVSRFRAFRWNADSGTADEGQLNWDTQDLFRRIGPLGEMERQEEYDAERGVFTFRYIWGGQEWEYMELPLATESFTWSAYPPGNE